MHQRTGRAECAKLASFSLLDLTCVKFHNVIHVSKGLENKCERKMTWKEHTLNADKMIRDHSMY